MASTLSRRLRTGLFYALRTAFRLTPMPESTRDALRERFIDRYSALVPPGPKGHILGSERSFRPYVRSDERVIGYVPYAEEELPVPLPATLVAFYLPQFHVIPENDAWWGEGFTEWRNVTRALPQFEGHHQPRLPGDLGFYDLNDPRIMRKQARLAREYGISAFCFYFYWFGGKTLLETPLRNWLADPTIDLSFCLCWANEKWTRTWDGRGDEILIDQEHSPADDLAFIAHVAEYLRDPRYLRVDGKPMLLVYRPGLFPDIKATTGRWRRWCLENGIGEIHLAYVQSFERPDPHDIGFDAAVEFPPNLRNTTSIAERQRLINPDFEGQVLDWRALIRDFQIREPSKYKLYPGISPGWDNEARRPGKGRVYLHSSPRQYGDWLRYVCKSLTATATSTCPIAFINAWNEWAEGAVLEPDARLGYAYLEATRRALKEAAAFKTPITRKTPCVVVHAWYPDVLEEIADALNGSGIDWELVVTTSAAQAEAVRDVLSRCNMFSRIIIFENRGRDILPFLHVANQLLDSGHDVVLKLHTKRSPHRRDGDDWRKDLINKLASQHRAKAVLFEFEKRPELGMVGPEGHVLSLSDHFGANARNIEYLVSRTGIAMPDASKDSFVSGSMFWVRLQALRPILDAHLGDLDFEAENGQIDGTLAHAVERIVSLCVRHSGMEIVNVGDICKGH